MPVDGEATQSRSIRPTTPFTLSLAQAVSYALAIGGVGFAIGAIYPRLLSVELAVEQLQRSQERTASTLARVTVIVERLDERQPRKVKVPFSTQLEDE